jgi:predicted MPP superfamily phosphohydrolase
VKRRKFLKNSLYGLAGTSLISSLYAWQIEPFWLEFVKIKMPIKNLPQHLEGRTLMQISDIHVGNRFDYTYLIESFKKAQDLNPDFVAYTGDYVNYENPTQFQQLDEVLQYSVKGKFGTVGILGNHDYGKDWAEQDVADQITMQLEKAGIRVLSNTQTEIEGLNFMGLDDYWALNFSPVEVLKKHNPTEANIVLCHNPDVCDLDVWQGYQGWILCGHTHGGQCKPPFLDPPILPVKNKRYSTGVIDLFDGRTLYINRALGHLWQVRFNVRPEITVFELQSM